MPDSPPPPPEFIFITGLSGSGKGTALRVFEDLGYYAVDNLPVDLIPKFVELCHSSHEIQRAALVVDVREGEALVRFPSIYRELRQEVTAMLLFLEAKDEDLQRRFSETRRPHPLAEGGTVIQKIKAEREKLAPVRALADMPVDTSNLTIHELRKLLYDRFGGEGFKPALRVTLLSFGFKHGVPTDSDLMFDVRFLPNPHYLPGGKELTGKDEKVIDYVRSFPQTHEFIRRISDLLAYLVPHYAGEGKSYLTIAIGCTGGRHRSVMMVDEIQRRLAAAGIEAQVLHRDIEKS